MSLLRVVAVGVLAGLSSGLFGIGGGIVMIAALVMLADFDHKLATGTALTAIVPIAISGVLGYAVGGEVDWAAAALIAVGAVPGAVVGTWLLVRVRAPLLQLVFSAAMVLAALRMVVGEANGDGRADLNLAMAAGLVVTGVLSGTLAGLLGLGGGIVVVPALVLLFGMPQVLAKGTSLAVIVPTAVMGTVQNRQNGFTALRPAATLGLAGMVSAAAASQLSLGMDPTVSSALFAAFLVVAAARLAYTAWQGIRQDDACDS